jgi:ubiquinone/menaquinone biosynthesis C-methylase UbiE
MNFLNRKKLNMGEKTSPVFSGKGEQTANKEMYAYSATLFADQIRLILPNPNEKYTLVDIGAHKGELMKDILFKLPEYSFRTIAVDINGDDLKSNTVAEEKIETDASSLPFLEKSIDITLLRYVLQWNTEDEQKKILNEIYRCTKGVVLLQHAGSPDIELEKKKWTEKVDEIFNHETVQKIKRKDYYFSSEIELEKWLQQAGFKYKKIESKTISPLSDILIERYHLNEKESEIIKDTLSEDDYIVQSTFVLHP